MEHDPDCYREPERPSREELRERGSRFIAECFRVSDLNAAASRIELIRGREHAATHHCTALRFGVDDFLVRYDDDGEPSGTAGLPILKQIEARALTNVLVVVTRYFGGTKLGTGGLSRAYGSAAALALDAAGIRERVRRDRVRIRFAYDDTSPAMQVVHRFDVLIESSEYTDDTLLMLAVRKSQTDAFCASLREALGGREQVERITALESGSP